MADTYTEVTRTGLFGNLMNSVIGAFLGVLLFFGSFFVLWINEGTTDYGKLAEKSQAMEAASIQNGMDGKFVAAHGALVSNDKVGDPQFLQPGPYIQLNRKVEMYAWKEEKKSETRKKLGGGSETVTTYSYDKEWTDSPDKSSSFKYSAGHENPEMAYKGATYTAQNANVGAYQLDPKKLEMPKSQDLDLANDEVKLPQGWRQEGNTLADFSGQPQVGDLRVSFTFVPNNQDATVFGTAQGQQIVPFVQKDDTLYRAFFADRATAIQDMHTEHKIQTWIFRGVGFFMMWIGLTLAFGPVNALLDIIPMVGNAGGCLISSVMFAVAAALSAVTIIIAIIAHNIILLALTIMIAIGATVAVMKMRGKKLGIAGM